MPKMIASERQALGLVDRPVWLWFDLCQNMNVALFVSLVVTCLASKRQTYAMEMVVPYDPLGKNRNGGSSSETNSHRDTVDSPDSARGVLSWPILWWSHCCSSEQMRHLTDTRDNYREKLSQRQEIWKSIRMIVVISCSCWLTFMFLSVFRSVFVFVVRVSSCGWLFVHILCICATLCNQKMRKQCRQPPKNPTS